jgi:anti-sigma B factor antagonist
VGSLSIHHGEARSLVITFAEEVLGGSDALELSSLIREACAEPSARIVLDLSAVRRMNSSGLGMLVAALATVRKHEARLYLASVPDHVMSLLTMTQLISVFDLQPTVDEALQAS